MKNLLVPRNFVHLLTMETYLTFSREHVPNLLSCLFIFTCTVYYCLPTLYIIAFCLLALLHTYCKLLPALYVLFYPLTSYLNFKSQQIFLNQKQQGRERGREGDVEGGRGRGEGGEKGRWGGRERGERREGGRRD